MFEPVIDLKQGAIEVSRYPYRHSSLHRQRTSILPARITCVFNSADPAFVLDGREVIVRDDQRDALAGFVRTHQIPDYRWEEVWPILSRPYLDHEYTKEEEARDFERLEQLRVSRGEVMC